MISRPNHTGFTLVEILMVIILMGILTVVTIVLTGDSADQAKFDVTKNEMLEIRNAMIGNPDLKQGASRASYGYLGDIGALPTAAFGIAGLITKPAALPSYSVSTTYQVGAGWNGPYLSAANSGKDYTKDEWGNAYVYSPAATPPTLVSYGADGAAGGAGFNQDITVTMPDEQRLATVNGYITQYGDTFSSDAEVEISYPDGAGVLTQYTDTVTVAENGYFSFSNVPFGVRSIKVYIPSVASPTSTMGPFILNVDRSKYQIPEDFFNVQTGGGGGGPAPPPEVVTLETTHLATAGTTITARRPHGVQSGDFLVAFHVFVSSLSATTSTAPAGWTAVASTLLAQPGTGGGVGTRAFYKTATATEPASYSFTINANAIQIITILRVRLVSATAPFHLGGTASSGTGAGGTSYGAPAVTTTTNNTLILRLYGVANAGVTEGGGFPAGHTGLWSNRLYSTGALASVGASMTQATAGTTGTATVTGTSARWGAWTIAIAPE